MPTKIEKLMAELNRYKVKLATTYWGHERRVLEEAIASVKADLKDC